MNRKYRIVEIEDGFRHVFYVERLQKLFWLIPYWARLVNPDSFRRATAFRTYEDAHDFILRARTKPIRRVY